MPERSPEQSPDRAPDRAPDRSPDPLQEARRQWLRHGWDDAADGMVAVTSVVRVHQLLMERIDAVLRPLGLTFARYEVLRLLSFTSTGSLPMTRLGSLLQVHPTSVTSAVDRLERQGHVERARDGRDRRVVRARLTDAGREVVERATAGLNADVFADLGLDREDVQELTRLLSRYRAAAGDAVHGTEGTEGTEGTDHGTDGGRRRR